MDDTRYHIFVSSAPGIEPLLARECQNLNFNQTQETPSPDPARSVDDGGGVLLEGGLQDVYSANLHLRTASRVSVRMGAFYADSFAELRKKAARLDWSKFIHPGRELNISVTCHKSRLYHSDAVAERVLGAINDSLIRRNAGSRSPETSANASTRPDAMPGASNACAGTWRRRWAPPRRHPRSFPGELGDRSLEMGSPRTVEILEALEWLSRTPGERKRTPPPDLTPLSEAETGAVREALEAAEMGIDVERILHGERGAERQLQRPIDRRTGRIAPLKTLPPFLEILRSLLCPGVSSFDAESPDIKCPPGNS